MPGRDPYDKAARPFTSAGLPERRAGGWLVTIFTPGENPSGAAFWCPPQRSHEAANEALKVYRAPAGVETLTVVVTGTVNSRVEVYQARRPDQPAFKLVGV